jgi:uncharacterized membrane protein
MLTASREPAPPGESGIGRRNKRLMDRETGRIEALSDGVFAIAITLLVLDLHVPQIEAGLGDGALLEELAGQWPAYVSFVTSFATILIMWMNHHLIFKQVARADALFTLANGALLMMVTAVPFPTALLSDYMTRDGARTAAGVYAGLFVVINIAYNLLWWAAAYRRRLLRPQVNPTQIRAISRAMVIGVPLYLTATLAALWSAELSLAIIFGLWVLWAGLALDSSRQTRQPITIEGNSGA